MKKRTTIGIALTLSTVALLTGCGAGDDGAEGVDGEDGAE